MESDVSSALQGRLVSLPGGRDKEGRPVLTVHIPVDSTGADISGALKYVLSIFSDDSRKRGLTVILDARKGPWRVARSCIRQVNTSLSSETLAEFLVLRPDAFWDKQRVENCTSSQKDGQVVFIPRSRLLKYVDQAQLPIELGGNFIFNVDQWFDNRKKIEEFFKESEECLKDLVELQERITSTYTLNPSQIQNNHRSLMDKLEFMKIVAGNCIEKGCELVKKIEYDNRNRKFASESESMSTPQDTLDSIDKLESSITSLRKNLIALETSRQSIKKTYINAKDLNLLQQSVAKVTNWILGPAEDLLKSKQKVGYDVASAEELRKEHEAIEMQCWNAYGAYAELVHKIEGFAGGEFLTLRQKDVISQKDFMDFVCRSFANRLERRRNILITSLRFFRLVAEYFDRTGEVFDSLVMGNKIGDFATAGQKLKELQENQNNLDAVERELVKEGEKLSDMLSMPVKDALGRDIQVDYSEDIVNIRDILDATTARKNIFSDSVELQKLTLEQVTHIHQYETDAGQAVQWLDELFHVLIRDHGHVGCTVYEIQAQKEEHQVFQETAKCTFNYGFQLLSAASALRQSCKIPLEANIELTAKLKQSWERLLNVTQEQMTRLRVSAVFHRSVEEQCNQLRDLREAVATIPLMDVNKKRARVRHYLGVRERLLVEVGRMVRLGRLLRSRLRETLYYDDGMSEGTVRTDSDNLELVELSCDSGENATAVEAISERLSEVTELAEELDQALKSAQQDCSISPAAVSLPLPITSSKKFIDGTVGTTDEEMHSSRFVKIDDVKSDDEFLTASDCTLQHSRSSSYNTASECEHMYSPWWEHGKDDTRENLEKEKMVLAVGLPELPAAKSVLKPSPECPPGMIAREVTETTHLKVQHSHTMGVKSYVLTSETVREKGAGSFDGVQLDGVRVEDGGAAKEDDFLKRLKECGDWVQLKILEVTPELTSLGNNLNEALELQKAHDEVLRQLQNKQSPVEELLRQADQLISTQKPRAEVYAAMAESLGRAWKDVNGHLELRKIMLDLNVQYHTRAQEFFDSMDALEAACSDTVVPIEIDAVKSFLTNIHELRRSVLESLKGALQAGNALIGKLKELGAEGTLDSRPERIRTSVNRAISQVQGWMDQLHLRRQVLELTFTRRKAQLEQCLALALLAADLRELEESVSYRRESLNRSDQLGDSSSSAELLQHELKKLLPEGKLLQERAIKITKATEQLAQSGCFAGEQATQQAYAVLSSVSDYLADLQHRDSLYERIIAFFRSAQTALTKLDQLEVQLKTTELPSTSPQLANLHAQCAKTIEEITSSPLTEGYALLQIADRGLNTSGIKRTVEELENRKISLDALCVAHKEENRRINRELNNFMEKQDELYSWLVGIAEAFLQGHQDMGGDSVMAKDFLDLHNRLLTDLQTKGNEINSLLLTLPPILEYLEDRQRHDVDQKVEALHERWLKLKNLLENRLDLAALYVKFHLEAEKVGKEMDEMETIIKKGGANISEEAVNRLEERMSNLIPMYQSAKNTGLNFINAAAKVTEPHLDTKRASVCVQSVLDRLAGRQLTVNRNWQTFHEEIVEKRETEILVETNIMESTKTITWVSKLDTQLYPVITTTATNPKDIAMHIEQKQQTVLPEIKRAQLEIEQRIKTTDAIMLKTPDEKTIAMRNKLNEMNQRLITITTDYQFLSQMMVAYFNNLSELDRSVEKFNKDFGKASLPKNPQEMDSLMRQFDASKQGVLNAVKFAQGECEEIVTRIHKQEPNECANQDIEKLRHTLQLRRENFDRECRARNEQLEAHLQFCQFDNDLQQINETLEDLSRQLAAVKGQYGESLATAKATSLAFVYFEKTIELLEQRIGAFVNTGEELIRKQHVHSPQISHHIQDLQNRWSAFKNQIAETRKLIDLSIRYFELIDQADEWFKEGSHLLVTIARRSTTVKHPSEAQQLLNEIEMFLKPGESKQNERIRQISELGAQLFGMDRGAQSVLSDNREMMESFSVISNELNTLAQNLRLAEEQRLNALKEQEEQRLRALKEEEQMRAKLEAARAEAAAAQAAAAAAEEARKTAEAAAKLLRETTLIKQIEIQKEEEIPKMESPVFTSPLSDQIIEEGSKFTFICQVTGIPLPVVTWHKDGISIQNNPDYQTTFDQGLCSLTIEETFAEDSARYTCKAINAAGSAETGAFLSVKENEPEEQLIPPSFVKLLQPGVARKGEPFQFECRVEGNPLPTVQWYKNADCIDNSPDYVITYNNGDAVLRFEQIFEEDRADYTCKAANKLGVAQSTANLNVLPSLEPTEIPTFVVPLSNVMARAGQKIKLECEVAGLPPPNLLWSHNGKPVKETRELKLQRDGQKATLVIYEAFPKDAGAYAVTASNLAGEASSACSVSVKGRLPAETSDSELASDMEPVKPSIQVPLKDISINEGNRVRLDCVIVGQPEPEVIWYHDDRPVKESSDIQLLFQGDRCSLIILEALLEDAGEYKVVALNSAGEASSKASLTVTPVKSLEKTETGEELKYSATGSAPKFSKLLTDILVSEGDKVILEACVSGEPRPDVKWLLNNTPVYINGHINISHDQEGNLRLEIDGVRPEDKGVYTVKASNSSGEAKCFAQLIVKSLRGVDSAKTHEEIKNAPVFKEKFYDRSVADKSSTKFECIVTGKPTPKIRWIFNDNPVSGKNFLISTSGDRQVLTIPEITQQNIGKITCLAENDAGKAECTAHLSVFQITPPEPETSLISQRKDISFPTQTLQHKESSFTYKREINVQSSTSTSSKITSISGEEPQIVEHKHSTKAEKSFRQINQNQPEIKESHHEEEYHRINNETPVIHEKSSSIQSIGTAKILPAQEIAVQKSIFKSRPPKFVTPVTGKIVDQDVNVVLEGILDAQPTPQVTWTKNGVEIKSGGEIKVSFERNCARLELSKVGISDGGRYTCTAVNDAGKAISTADLVVKKTVFPPVFGRRLQAQVIKKGDRVKMEVEVTGTPDPEVSWYKDGKPLSEAIKDGYRARSQGNSHTVIIEKAETKHTGTYMVRAVNSGGEAQSIADIAIFEPTPDTMVEVVKTVVFEDVRKHETLTSAADKSSETITTKPIISLPESFKATPKETLTTEISTHVENVIKHDTKTLTMERTTPVPDIEMPKKIERKQEFVPIAPPDTIDEGIQTSSISKQQSLDYFVKKMNQAEEVKPKEIVKPGVIKQEMYTKFEEVQGDLLPKLEPFPVQKEVKQYTSFSKQQVFSTKTQEEEFQLVPEPPAEICFQEGPESLKKEDVSVKVKRLEESRKELSSTEIPSGAVKIFPTAETKSFSSTSTTSASSAMYYKAETIGPVVKQQPPEQVFESSSLYEKPSYLRPLSSLSTGSAAGEPNAEGLAMEKTWAHKHSECNIQKSWPPQQTESPKIAPTWSAQSTLEKKWAPVIKEEIKPPVVEIKKEETFQKIEKQQESFQKFEKQEIFKPPVVEMKKEQSFQKIEQSFTPVELRKEEIYKTVTPVVETKKEQQSFQKVEKSFKKEVIPVVKGTYQTTTKTEIFEDLPPPLDVPHYIAKVSHTSNVHEFKQESSFMEKKVEMKAEVQNEFISEDRNVKPSEMIKAWPPKPKEPEPVVLPEVRPVSVQDISDEIYLEPGTPPEIAYAQPPPAARKVSLVETIEQDLEKTLEKAPTRVLPGAVRTIPPKKDIAPKLVKPVKVEVPSKPFEKFPELEPFPFKPDPVQPKPAKLAPPPTPSKFIKGKFTDSDYESDFEAVKIPPKWKPYASDTEDFTYKHVNAPKFTAQPRSRSIDKEVLPPSKFDQPPQITGPPRPAINFEACKQLRKKQTHTQVHEIRKTTQKMQTQIRKPPSPPLQPGTPPEYVQAEPPRKPQSPKTKHKLVVDGYMADTDEPFIQQQKKVMKTEYEFRQQQQSQSQSQSFSGESVQKTVSAPKITHHHKKHVASSSSMKKKLVSTPIMTSEKIEALEPFPYKPDPPTQKSAKLPPPPSPSRFVKGEFKESDYESDYEGRIPPVWRSEHEMYYKPVRPLLTPTGRQQVRERTPTPPTEFDRPEAVPMPTRPKFEPIEKPKKSVKLEEIIKPVQPIFKPKPIQAVHDVIVATPAVPEKVIVLQPGTPPELAYAPPKTTQYYRSTTSAPYHNAIQTETSNVMHFDESTDKCHRTVSVQQTTKVIKFGERKSQIQELEPFPFKPDPERPRRGSAPPPPRPKKFVPGEFRESDYESEVENARIKPKWLPSQSDTEEPHYRKVRAPAAARSSSVPSHKERVMTPMEFDTQPPYQARGVDFESTKKEFSKRESRQLVKSNYENNIQPGSPPEYGYAPQKVIKSTATKIASQHMDSMTSTFKSKAQQFVSDVMDDVNKKSAQKPILKGKDDSDGQVYREETRAAQYGTKHIDPDTGLIYFKYDFGYEFGVILPGESKNGEIPMPKKTVFQPPKRQQSIEMPVQHERTTVAPQFQPKKFSAPGKNVKWDPTSESEMSEYEGDGKKKNKWEQSSCSPMSLSPSLPSTSPAFNNYPGSGLKGTETPPSCPSTPGMQNVQKRAPVFITPLRDIAVVSGQTARFECIVQSEPPPDILWSKNGRIIENSNDNQIFFRNGVCRLTIPKAFPEDAGTYSCTATNQIGAVNTTATLQVPGERRSSYI